MAEEIPPKGNIETYRCLFQIENALRELIIESLSDVVGPKWYKHRLPPDILDKYRKGIDYERASNWVRLIPHHPIYYVEFPDLKKIIERSDNWRDVFRGISPRKDILIATLSELEPVRNKVAHNRVMTQDDVNLATAAREALSNAIGSERFSALASRCTYAKDIPSQLAALREESARRISKCTAYEPLGDLPAWQSVSNQWWFDESYLGAGLDEITSLFRAFEEYANLPRGRGTGHRIEKWVRERNVEQNFETASREFSELLKEWGHHDRSFSGS